MVDWQALEGIGGVATGAAVAIALVFGLMQLREAARHRLQAAAHAAVGSFLATDFITGLDRILALADDEPRRSARTRRRATPC